MMHDLSDYRVHIHPLSTLRHEMDLIFYDGPFLSLFRNRSQETYLYYWCDSDDNANRWLVFRVPQDRITAYVQKQVSLRDLILRAADGMAYVADIDDALIPTHVYFLHVDAVPPSYLPPEQSFYNAVPVNISVDLQDLSQLMNSDLLNVHLIRGEGVEFGSASISTLGDVLSSTGNLSESIAVKKYAGRQAGKRVTKQQARAFGTFQYVSKRAASFSAVLRPMVPQLALPGFEPSTADVVSVFLNMLENGRDYEALRTIAEEYGDEVMKALEAFVDTVRKHHLDVQINWVEIGKESPRSVRTSVDAAAGISQNIKRLDLEGSGTIRLTGRFTALDTKTHRYSFQSSEGVTSTGRVAAEGISIRRLSFDEKYDVTISRRVMAGVRKPKVLDTIIEVTATDFFDLDYEAEQGSILDE